MEPQVVAISQARTGSSRLPNKVLQKIQGKTLLEIHIDRVLNAKSISKFIIATTSKREDDEIAEIAFRKKVSVLRGSENDVLDRFYKAWLTVKYPWIARLTCDCPLIDPELIDNIVNGALKADVDYYSNTLVESFPDGQDVEVFKDFALKLAWTNAKLASEREHVTQYIIKNSSARGKDIFTAANYLSSTNFGKVRLTVDEPVDLEVISQLIDNLGFEKTWKEYTSYYIEKDIGQLNDFIPRNEGLFKSERSEKK